MTDIADFLARLRRIADGGMRACERDKKDGKFWDGYRQAVDDMDDFIKKQGTGSARL